MKLTGIYKITSPTNKIYIGQSINIENRFKQYKYTSNNKIIGPKLYNSLKKYGSSNHKFEIIEECSIDQLNEREIYWKKHILEDIGWRQVLFCELFDKGGGPRSEQTKLKTSLSLKGKSMINNMKKVEKYSLDGILIEEFNSQIEAAANVKSKQSAAISECCKNKRKNHKGFIWKFKI
jgi:group I intron endonuclease